jgi:hypothetical protein
VALEWLGREQRLAANNHGRELMQKTPMAENHGRSMAGGDRGGGFASLPLPSQDFFWRTCSVFKFEFVVFQIFGKTFSIFREARESGLNHYGPSHCRSPIDVSASLRERSLH